MKRTLGLKVLSLVFVAVICTSTAWAKTVTLSWDASPSAVTGYKVYYDTTATAVLDGTGATEGDSPIDVGNVLTYVIHGLADDAEHHFAVTAYDASGNESTYSNTVFSPPVGDSGGSGNNPPTLDPIGTKTVAEGTQLTFTISATDPNNDPLSYSASDLPDGSTFNPATRSFDWTPEFLPSENTRVFPVTFKVSDGVAEDSEVVTINVVNINREPILDPIGQQVLAEGDIYNLVISATDPDGDPLTYSATPLPSGAVFIPSTRSFSWIPENNQAGSYRVVFTASDGSLNDSETVEFVVEGANHPPVISGDAATSVTATTNYSFTPAASDPDGDSLVFSITNRPEWLAFSTETGTLSGLPGVTQVGSYVNIILSVSDGTASSSLPPFSIDVIANTYQDPDGQDVVDDPGDSPGEGSEWVDTDGDQISDIDDLDDDNDGIADLQDGFPLDATRSDWTISATTSAGGFLTPEGETSVAYAGFQRYQLTPMTGYYIGDLLVDQVSVGAIAVYDFADVRAHHTISARFSPIPVGLSCDPSVPGLMCVGRVDGGDVRTNLVDGKPKQDLDYQFRVVLRDPDLAEQNTVFLHLDGYRYAMDSEGGTVSAGADYTFTTRLGPAFSHRFYFSAEDPSGYQLWRYPQDGDLPGPTVELLNGRNLSGIAAAINGEGLNASQVFDGGNVYRWIAGGGTEGAFELTGSGAPITSGEGYVLKRLADPTLTDFRVYSDISDSTYEIPVKPGWNLISNPYGGNVRLADVKLRVGGADPELWLDAAESNLLQDGIYSYLGTDWGDQNEFSSAVGEHTATLIPWIGYWIYLNPTEQEASLVIPKPLQ